MCEKKELFDGYKPCDASDVVMDNSSRRNVFGMSTIKMKMFDEAV